MHQENGSPGAISLKAFVGNQFAHRDTHLVVPFRVSKVFPCIVNHQDIDWLQIGGEFSHCPVLLLSSKNDELDKILGLAVGGDDYVTKPFSPKDVGRILRIFKIKKNVEVTDNGKDDF